MDLLNFMMMGFLCLVVLIVTWCVYSFIREFSQRSSRTHTPSTPQELIARQTNRKRSIRRSKNRFNTLINGLKPRNLFGLRLNLPVTTAWLTGSLLFLLLLSVLVTLGQPDLKNRTLYRYASFKTEANYESSEDNSKAALAYINQIRKRFGKTEISFDQRAFGLAVARAKDQRDNSYLDHTNPKTGSCPDNMKSDYGLQLNEYVAENGFGNPVYSEAPFTRVEKRPMSVAIDSWMNSRGHRYNLLYDHHVAGAVGCYKNMCVFLGLNHNRFGEGCYKAADTSKQWQTAPRHPGEVVYQ